MSTNQELKDAITSVVAAWSDGDLAAAVRNAAALADEPAPDSTYLVAWIGGEDVPSYQAFDNEDDAFERAEDWYSQAEEGIDSIDVLKITGTVVERMQRKQA